MHWMVAHVYVVLLAVLVFMAVAGGLVITDRTSGAGTSANTWGRTGGFAFLGTEPATPASSQAPRSTTPNVVGIPGDYTTIQFTSSTDGENETSTLPDEWQSLLKQLTQQAAGDVRTSETREETGAYSFIPQGLISITDVTEDRTPEQEALYTYGNQVGSLIRAFDESHTGMLTTLKDAYADRTNATKREAAERIGTDYEALGKGLEALYDVPPSVKKMHTAIAQSYQDAGKKMVAKLRTQTDEELLAAMHAYNASVLQFTNNFVALATYLSANGVKFGTSDPGSIFTFTSF